MRARLGNDAVGPVRVSNQKSWFTKSVGEILAGCFGHSKEYAAGDRGSQSQSTNQSLINQSINSFEILAVDCSDDEDQTAGKPGLGITSV